jgi:hypothetical protein
LEVVEMRRNVLLSVVLLGCFFVGTALGADKFWDGEGVDDSWMTSANWDLDTLPLVGDRVFLDVAGDTILVEAGDSVQPRKIIGPCENAVGTVTMTVEGELSNSSYWYMAREAGGTGILNMGGLVTTRDLIVAPGDGYAGIVNISAGLLDIYGNGSGIGAYFGSDPVAGTTTGSATVNVLGGTLNIALLNPMGSNALIDIAGGEMILLGDQISLVDGYAQNDQIVAYGGAGILDVSTFEAEGVTYTRVVPEPSTLCLLALGGFGLLRKRK